MHNGIENFVKFGTDKVNFEISSVNVINCFHIKYFKTFDDYITKVYSDPLPYYTMDCHPESISSVG